MKVYVVHKMIYDGIDCEIGPEYEIAGVFSSKEMAEAFCEYYGYTVNEYTLDSLI
jgi:hypothetical protein